MSDNVHYFLGVDPAPALGKKSDDGALAALRAQPFPGIEEPTQPEHWQLDYVWAYKLRGAGPRQWSGLIHQKHQHFQFSGILLDAGAGGQGPSIMLELRSNLQLIEGINTFCKPIATPDDTTVADADFILTYFKRGDVTVENLWPSHTMRGDDNLVHNCHVVFQEAFEHGRLGLPVPYNERPKEETARLNQESDWALRVLSQGIAQLHKIVVETRSDGTWAVTNHGALKFSSTDKKDIAYAMMFAYVRFLIWLKSGDEQFLTRGADADMCHLIK
jgi:hypothetical protein